MPNLPYQKLLPTGFLKYIESGGSTKPWLITLQQMDGEELPYVVKPFTLKTNQQIAATAKEVFGNLLAREFDLPVPNFALTNFSKQFIDTLTAEQQKELATRDTNWKFAAQFIEGTLIFNLQKDRQRLKEYDIAKLYAFDCLCFNLDRGGFRGKPNLLVDDESFWLIDHEQIFPFAHEDSHAYYKKVIVDFENETTSYPYDYHLFHSVLKQLPTRQKKDVFGEVAEYLRNINLQKLQDAANRLEEDSVLLGSWQLMVHYLATVKAAPQKFEAILLKSIL